MKNTTINKKEIVKFSKIAEDWWNPEGKFKPLHKFNPARIKYIKERTSKHYKILNQKTPFKNLNVLDIGCGGGLLSEPIAKLGAKVTGIDASDKNIKAAKIHSSKNNLNIDYYCCSPENFNSLKKFDLILNMEIVEHVEDVNFFIKQSSKFLKKNGLMFVATINRTLKSYLFAIVGAEYILRWLPIGTHEWNKFLTPDELIKLGKNNYLEMINLDGMIFNPIKDSWRVGKDNSVNYIIQFTKR
ncbi:bifunctional 2-polyprenyl-6-hydroxyphenol methylase/3-demethylubiquinol 3-O-methyltransferase UbiG [Pelagibacterales bacterium SAG-MED15]|nr:bifunctional 2-polyprenyl-6-hydroxyphenol methylase/3-demethylubiquinol 3-O-methyltransferase UbiG [Pelagibacterales bacterium SAG-MED15]